LNAGYSSVTRVRAQAIAGLWFQAVAKLNAVGQRSGDLLLYAAESLRRAERLDAVAEEIRKTPVIAKIGDPRGERPGGLIYYLVGPGRREEHVDPHLVAGWRLPTAERAASAAAVRSLLAIRRIDGSEYPARAHPSGVQAIAERRDGSRWPDWTAVAATAVPRRSRPGRTGFRTCRRSRHPWSRPSRPSAPAPSGSSSTGSCAR
jgi:hypothetical protein